MKLIEINLISHRRALM